MKKKKKKLLMLRNRLKAFSISDLFRLYFIRAMDKGNQSPCGVYSPYFHKKVVIRPNTTDWGVFMSVLEGYHLPMKGTCASDMPFTIMDLGCNIGLTLLDFKRLYPSAKIFGVEMDSDNVKMALTNCANEDSIQIIHAAISCADGWVQYDKAKEADTYSICSPTQEAQALIKVPALSMRSLMERLDIQRIDYLKMDIEGAEHDLFAVPEEELSWLSNVRQINIEYHYKPPDPIIQTLEEHGFCVEHSKTHWASIFACRG